MLRPAIITILIVCSLIACRKDDVPAPTPTGPVTQTEINRWMLDSMRYFYLWNNTLPPAVDTTLGTTDYFTSLKYKDDRFSFLYKANDISTYPKYMLYQFGIAFSVIASPTGTTGVIQLVIPGTVADIQGLKRGITFTAINNIPLTSSNAGDLTSLMLTSGLPATLTTGIGDITLPSQNLAEPPIYQQNIFTINGKKVAYLFYNYFNDAYNTALLDVFQSFKIAGATELILDLRYNPGGSVAAAAMLNAMIAPGITEQSSFVRYAGNSNLGTRTITYKNALSVPESGKAISFASLIRLALPRVFILSGAATASAAELTINSLKPYTQVIQIGETTYGKDKGAILISDNRNPQRIPWTLMPITYNLLNANNNGNYTSGIKPDHIVDEMATLPLVPLGDQADPLIVKALSLISGNTRQNNTTTIVRHYYNSQQAAAAQEIVRCR